MFNLFGKQFKIALASIFLVEVLSFVGFFYPAVNEICFFALVLAALILSIRKLEYGLWMVLVELFISSKGYLFSFNIHGFELSIRIALWLVVMSVWFGKTILNFKEEKPAFLKSSFLLYYLVLFAFIIWGGISGLLRHNGLHNIFFDFNGWVYFALVFPIYDVFLKGEGKSKAFLQVISASVLWLCLKTFALLFMFSHNIGFLSVYKWIRDTGVGEITQMQGGFFRIFFQSHLYVLIFFLIFLVLIFNNIKENACKTKNNFYISLLALLSMSTVLISFSRSFWIGLAAGFLVLYIYFFISKFKIKDILVFSGVTTGIIILSFGFLFALVRFPYPNPLGGFNAIDLLSDRASQISGEAGVSSRWALLPKITGAIKQAPFFGKGFGATVTYKSQDPRVLAMTKTGEYTTYAFEWGWLDIWLKLGFFGALAYLALLLKVFGTGFKTRNNILVGLVIGLIILGVVNIFSPYTNHPLGIGYLLLISAILDRFKASRTPLA